MSGQLTVRSRLPWRTIETDHFAFHYPVELELWTRDLASHIEAIDSAVRRVVGYAPSAKTQVVVDDPYEISNGSAWPYLNRPVVSLWATPPDPHDDIGEFTQWNEMVATHEFAHIAHLTRPSRNTFTRRLWEALPVDLGPVAIRAPRWVVEGYATYVEGRVTKSGRPNGTWRPAILRQWALEGQLPAYEQLNSWGAYEGGAFAYLAGSAFLEWLADRRGDSSLVQVWRRLSARQNRSFDDAFTGVYGESARTLYGRFAAELTSHAFAIEHELRENGVADTGTIVQRTAWTTGDPAISPDGQRVALVLRSASKPSRVVIWKTAPEPDTARARRDSLLLKRDPEDVPARSIYPPPKKSISTLRSAGGSPYESPRFLRDGRVLLWRRAARGDGSLETDLYIWDPERHRVRRITRGASLRDPDPAPDGRSAVATRCRSGWCDVVAVDLASGATRTLLRGGPSHSFYRPRLSPSGKSAVVSVAFGARWRLASFRLEGGTSDSLRFIGPNDGANRYDPSYISADTIVVVSTRGGIANLERLDLASGTAHSLTRVTGAAVGPEYNPADRSIWFLSLYSRGYDVRRIEATAAPSPPIVALDPRLTSAAPLAAQTPTRFSTNAVTEPRRFGFGPRLFRWIPLPLADADGGAVGLGLVSTDVIGRSEILLVASAGDASQSRGAAPEFTWRGTRPSLRLNGFSAEQQPSASRSPVPLSANLDVRLSGGEIAADDAAQFDTWGYHYRIGASAAAAQYVGQSAAVVSTGSTTRALAFADAYASLSRRGDTWSASATVGTSGSGGKSFDRSFTRGTASVGFAVRAPGIPLISLISGTALYGATNSGSAPFEQFAIGGGPSVLLDHSLMTQRITMPALPTATSIGPTVFAYRVGLTTQPITWYLWSGSTAQSGDPFEFWHRVVGIEWSQSVGPIPFAGTPAARAQLGLGESLDAPFRHKLRGYVSLVLNP
jgi:hypothetical protein